MNVAPDGANDLVIGSGKELGAEMKAATGGSAVKSFQDWLKEGEDLYDTALREYQGLEAQIDELEKQLTEKKAELNQIAQVIGKPPVEGNRRLSAQIVEPGHGGNSAPGGGQGGANPSSAAAIARAITGRSLGR